MTDSSAPNPTPNVLQRLENMVTSITGPWTFRNVLTWIGLIAFVLTVRWLLMEPYSIPTGSMEPTLHGDPRLLRGDRIAVNKLVYGPRVPFMNKRLFHLSEPKRWDIVVVHSLDPQAAHPTLVKRLIGLPGERIHIANGKIEVNGTPVEPPPELQSRLYYTTRLKRSKEDVQTFILQMIRRDDAFPAMLNPANPGVHDLIKELNGIRKELNGRNAGTLDQAEIDRLFKGLSPLSMHIADELLGLEQAAQYPLRYGVQTEDEFAVVPPNCYLVLGDNSGDSVDGRYFGWLPNDSIYGRAVCIWWPIGRWRDFTGFSKTWWGKSILYGPPVLLVAYEIVARIRR
ncbi:MAG: signal peptidase I, partial [Candidatus Hydrogenedentes bacterium]|nr:signal peptidase I [Candidatus Hydrogenedentota bacterium]